MTTLVIDASVAAKWFLPEPDAALAKALLTPRHMLIAPDLLWIELAQIAWKNASRGSLTRAEAERLVDDARGLPVESFDSTSLLTEAVRLAVDLDCSVYDCMYLALAVEHEGVGVTADERFINALKGSPHIARLRQLSANL